MRVGICIATYRRREGALKWLEALGQQEFTRLARPDISLVLASNEEDPGLQELVRAKSADLVTRVSWLEVIYATEARRGIPYARNLASQIALEQGVDYLVYVDDDEEPSPTWLEELLVCQQEVGADVIYGAVESRLEGVSAFWQGCAAFFEYPRYSRGMRLKHAYTHNVLVAARVFGMVGGFDERWGLNGGDDNAFFRHAAAQGFSIVACPESVVVEIVGPSRANLNYFCRRSFRFGNSEGLLEVLGPSLRGGRVICVLRSVGMLGVGFLRSLLALLSGDAKRILSAGSKILFAAGLLSGCLGWRYEIYR
jgi:succinoglycan biosynthesis protein ExoM